MTSGFESSGGWSRRLQARLAAGGFIAFAGLPAGAASAAPGDLDASFDPGSGINGTVFAAAVQPDGRIVIGGEFSTVHGAMRRGIARLHPDGSCDPSFDPGTGVTGRVDAIALQPDGRILIGGDLTAVNGRERPGLARLEADGRLDESYAPQLSAALLGQAAAVTSLIPQADGSVLVGGVFSEVDGIERHGLARLTGNGDLDLGFVPPPGSSGAEATIIARSHALAVQADGKVLTLDLSVNEVLPWTYNYYWLFIRLNPDGSRDEGFGGGSGPSDSLLGAIHSIVPLPNGKILVGGDFVRVSGVSRPSIARLNSDGSLDTGFGPDSETVKLLSGVRSMLPLADGAVLIGNAKSFQVQENAYIARLLRLHDDGTVDRTFSGDAVANGSVQCLAGLPDGKIIAAGDFSAVDGMVTNRVARFHADGTQDAEFDAGAGFDYSVYCVAAQPEGKVLVGGGFAAVQKIERPALCLLHADGTADESFDAGLTGDPFYNRGDPIVESMAVQPDGKLLIGGQFTGVHGASRNRIARLHPDGRLDESFAPGDGISGSDHPIDSPIVRSMVLQPDGAVLAGGTFSHVDGEARRSLARFGPDGTLDDAFVPELETIQSVYAVALQSDGKVLVGGSLASPVLDPESGWEYFVSTYSLMRVNADGTRDTGFEEAIGDIDPEHPFRPSHVYAVAPQTDGSILIGGSFTTFKGAPLTALARLHADGSLDSTFDAVIEGTDAQVQSILLHPDGYIVIAGYFDTVSGVDRHGIARLEADGSLDESFDVGAGADHLIASLALQRDGKVLVGGLFARIGGETRPYLARLLGDHESPLLHITRAGGFVQVSWPSTHDRYTLETSADLGRLDPWSPVSESAIDDGSRLRVEVPIDAARMFFRLAPSE